MKSEKKQLKSLSVRSEPKSMKASRGRTPMGEPNPVDVHVGERIRLRRMVLGYSQEKLANMLGLTFQQVQKYEKGMNRVSASRLWDIGKVLAVSMDFFYMDMGEDVALQSPRTFSMQEPEVPFLREEHVEFDKDPMKKKEALELVRAYYKIPNRDVAHNLFDLMLSMSKTKTYNKQDTEQE